MAADIAPTPPPPAVPRDGTAATGGAGGAGGAAATGDPGSTTATGSIEGAGATEGAARRGGVEVRTDGGVTSVRFWGAIDLAVRQAAAVELRRVPHVGTPLDVDCRDVTFMDSTGMSVLVRVVRDAAADGRPVHFLGATPQVADLLAATGVDRWMESQGVRTAP